MDGKGEEEWERQVRGLTSSSRNEKRELDAGERGRGGREVGSGKEKSE